MFSWAKKNCFFVLFSHANIKKPPSKVAHNRPQTFFSSTGPAAQTSPELIFHIIKMSQQASVLLSVVFAYIKFFGKFLISECCAHKPSVVILTIVDLLQSVANVLTVGGGKST